MTYEYESDIPKFLKGIESEHPLDLSKEIKEIQEVYCKACAFDRIAEVHSDNDLYSDEYVLETIQEQIDKLEGADDE